MPRNRKGKQDMRFFKQIISVLIVVICILLFRGTGICAGGMGGMNDQCLSNFECSNRYFCDKNISDCDGEGICEDKPRYCDEVRQPVCGCDGSTYPSECEANKRGISIDYFGQCIPGVITDCINNTECPTDSYCQKIEGNCTGQGTCIPRPLFCAQIWDPVCGCDENTYNDECEASLYGVNVLYEGECSLGIAICTNNNDCLTSLPGSYCQKGNGNCTGQGTCAPRPTTCAQIYDPVCGCDGVTYSNECQAKVQGVNVAYIGECEPGGGVTCTNNSGCSSNSFCQKTTGNCAAQGTCTVRPHMCPDIWDPVCGCDGKIYSSECKASLAGVSVNHKGDCTPGVNTCTSNSACPSGSYCQKTLGNCTSQGECVPAPVECPDLWSPVCGCDGKTYSNECYAAANGINLDSMGECSTATGACTDSSTCSTGEYCQKTSGKCDTGEGLCVTKPEVCPQVWSPVCGCNGKTYSNECEAALKGVNVNYTGECAGTGPSCLNNSNCQPGTMCQKTPGKCTEQGLCTPPPTSCPDIWAPVCGCDGMPYPNGCTATSNGVNIDYAGQCSGSGTACTNNSACPYGSYCDKITGDCAGQGTCVPAPTICPQVWEPVCGCDGKTYSNECEASKAGINTDYTGECSTGGMWCQTNSGCPAYAYCKKAGCTESFGKCTVKPEFCVQVNSPVCGCDGKTYSNECVAATNGVGVKSTGECPTYQPPPGWPYGGFIGGLYGGGFMGGLYGGGFMGGLYGGGFMGGFYGGGFAGGLYGGGFMGGFYGGGFAGGLYGGGFTGGLYGGGFMGGFYGGGLIGGLYGGGFAGGLYGGGFAGGLYGGGFTGGGFIGLPYGGMFPGFGYPFSSSSGTGLPTIIQ